VYEYKAIVDRIIDGDTLDADIWLGFDVVLPKQRIRLWGIDTPESRTRDLEEKARGLLSKYHLQGIAPVGSRLRLESKDKGKFGRILGIIYADEDEKSINQRMCDEGYAVEYFGGSKGELKAKHMANRDRLIEQGILEP
jgi:micrococcal nuclease